jgi:hypothetical protein
VVAILQASTGKCFDTKPSGNCKGRARGTPKPASRKSQPLTSLASSQSRIPSGTVLRFTKSDPCHPAATLVVCGLVRYRIGLVFQLA